MFHFRIRRLHRWLGLLIGIQFLAWTISGLYFSWSDMDEVHGDYDKARPTLLDAQQSFASPDIALDSLRKSIDIDSLAEIKLVSILGRPCWQISYFPRGHEHHQKK